MNLLSDIITYVRRIIKSPSNAVVTDNLIIDYINRFWIMDVDARIQVFDLKTKYQFQTSPGVDQYNMPLYNVQTEPGAQDIGMYPVYQGFVGPCYINGIQVSLETQKQLFFNVFPNVTQNLGVVAVGDGTIGPYTLNFPILSNTTPPINPPITGMIRGHIDISGIIATGNNVDPPLADQLTFSSTLAKIPSISILPAVYITSIDSTGSNVVVADSGIFLRTDVNYGMLMTPGPAPDGNAQLSGGYSTTINTVNYFSGIANLFFPVAIPLGQDISVQCQYFQSGLPRNVLYYNNTLTLRAPPAFQYLVELDAYLTPSAFLSTGQAIPFGYMAEYIARGAARKMLSDTGDVDQFMFYEPLFKEQELLVWKRSQRQWTANRTETIYSRGNNMTSGIIFGPMGGGI